MITAYKKFWKHYADFKGKSSRPEHWWAMLCQIILISPLLYVVVADEETIDALLNSSTFLVLSILAFIYLLATLVPMWASTVRRLRDAGFHWAMVFVNFIPLVGSWILLVLTCMPTKDTTPTSAQLSPAPDSSPEVLSTPEKIITANETNSPEQAIEDISNKDNSYN